MLWCLIQRKISWIGVTLEDFAEDKLIELSKCPIFFQKWLKAYSAILVLKSHLSCASNTKVRTFSPCNTTSELFVTVVISLSTAPGCDLV